MIHDPNGMYARNSPDSYTSGFPLMMSSAGIGHNPYEFRSPPALSPTSFNPYESFMLPHGPHPMVRPPTQSTRNNPNHKNCSK